MRLALALVGLALLAPLATAKGITIHAGGGDGRLYFDPKDITAREGDLVSVTLVNDDASTPHDWALLEYGGNDIEVYVRGGETKTVNFTAVEAGEFRIVCQVVGHKQRGMEGTLTVERKLVPAGAAPLLALALAGAALVASKGVRRDG